MSVAFVSSSPVTCSGAMYEAVPLVVSHATDIFPLVLRYLMHGYDIRVPYAGRLLCLFSDSFYILRRNKRAADDRFDGDYFVEALLMTFVDDAHSPAANLFEQVV